MTQKMVARIAKLNKELDEAVAENDKLKAELSQKDAENKAAIKKLSDEIKAKNNEVVEDVV